MEGQPPNRASRLPLVAALIVLVIVAGIAAYVVLTPTDNEYPAGDLSVTMVPPTPLIAPGQVQNYSEVQVETLVSGLNGTLAIEVSSPPGLTVDINQTSATLTDSPLAIPVALRAAASLSPGYYSVTLEARSNEVQTKNVTFTVDVVPVLIIMQWPTFHPQNVTVPRGTPVTWLNVDSTIGCCDPGDHDVSFSSGANATSPILTRFESWTYTFEADGVVDYYCTIHPVMKGQVTVTG